MIQRTHCTGVFHLNRSLLLSPATGLTTSDELNMCRHIEEAARNGTEIKRETEALMCMEQESRMSQLRTSHVAHLQYMCNGFYFLSEFN